MNHRNTKLKIVLLLCFLFIYALVFAMTRISKIQRIDLAVNTNIKNLQTQFDIINRFHDKDASAIYHATQSHPRIQAILLQIKDADKEKKDILRVELHNQLKEKYKYMKLRGVLQYHFVMPDNTTFLRMHKPEKYNDDLGEIRHSFANTNKTHEPTFGFEQGKTAHAFRNTYPILDKDGNYLCALDIGYGSEGIQNHLTQVSQLHTHFLVHKDIFSVKAWERKWLRLKYIQSVEHEDYMFAITKEHTQSRLDKTKQALTKSNKATIKKNMNSGKSFGFYSIQDKKAIVTAFMPIKNIQNKKVVAYLVSYRPDSFIDTTILFIQTVRFVIFFLLSALFYFIYKNILAVQKEKEFSVELEQKVKNRTAELQQKLEEIKMLKGLLPICANCKKIRDDKGYWNQIEGYIQTHSEAKFSHGMCPECSDKLYGKEDWYIEMKKKKSQEE